MIVDVDEVVDVVVVVVEDTEMVLEEECHVQMLGIILILICHHQDQNKIQDSVL